MAFNLAGAFLFRFICGANVMRDLTENQVLGLISKNVADLSEEVVLCVPSRSFERPFIMYHSLRFGYTKTSLTNSIKLDFKSGIYKYTPKPKPFDITKHEFSDPAWSINEIDVGQGYIDFYNHETCTDDGDADTHVLDKDDAIAIAKALGVTGEYLK